MDKWVGKTAVVTGASAGIGAAIAISLAKAGVNVIGLARRKDRVEALGEQVKGASGQIQGLVCDVSDPKSIDAAFEWIEKNVGKIHIWINNAGVWRANNFTNDGLKDEDIINTINTNITGLALCTRKAVKMIEKTGEPGYIININSIAGQLSASKMMVDFGVNIYSGTKHAVTNVTDVYRIELASKPNNLIKVSSISPGVVSTEIFGVAGLPEDHIKQFDALKSEDIADSVIYLLSTPSSVNVTELTIRPMNSVF